MPYGNSSKGERARKCWVESALVVIEPRFLHAPHQFRRIHAVRLSESMNCSKRGTLYAAFDGAQLCSIDPEFLVDVELRKTCLVSNLTQHVAEGLLRS